MDALHEKGFTLLELLITLAIAGILLGIGVPSFSAALHHSRMSADYQAVVGALFLARSEAVKQSATVTICPRAGESRCGNDWTQGYLVFADPGSSATEETAQIDPQDTVLLSAAPLSSGNRIRVYGIALNESGAPEPAHYVRYRAAGNTLWSKGSITLCDPDGHASTGRVINISLTGGIQRGRSLDSDGTPLDAFEDRICV